MLFSAVAEGERSDYAITRSPPPRGAAISFQPMAAAPKRLDNAATTTKPWLHSARCHITAMREDG